jgi:hypothetical protein
LLSLLGGIVSVAVVFELVVGGWTVSPIAKITSKRENLGVVGTWSAEGMLNGFLVVV